MSINQPRPPDLLPRPPGDWSDERLEQVLRQSQANLLRYHELFDYAPDAYLVTDLQAVIQEANHAAAILFDTRKEFLVNKPLVFYVAEADQRAFAANLTRVMQPAQSLLNWEMTLRRPRAAPVYVLVSATTVQTSEQMVGLRWTFKDITRRKLLEERLRDEKEFADNLVEMANVAIVVLDEARRMQRVNTFLCEQTDRWHGELIGRPFADLLVEEDRPAVQKALLSTAVSGVISRGVHRLRTRKGPTRLISWSARSLPGETGRPKQILLVANDMTDLHQAQQRALQAERLAGIGQMAAGLAHESRNCLQRSHACLAMLGFRLQNQPDALDLLRRAEKAQEDLYRLFEEVREYAAPLSLELCPCLLADTWRQAWENLASVRELKDIEFVEEIADVNLEIVASPFHLIRVFRNLFENSLAAGAIRIEVRFTAVELDGRAAIQVAIQDNGTGFAQNERQRAFEDFFTTKVQGTGLGLAICKRIIEAHEGRIVVGELAEPGAILVITLPRRPA
jgi:PAS domain S-box-containing protein